MMHNPVTPSVAWLSISSRPPDESYTGVTVSVGRFGAAKEGNYKILGESPTCIVGQAAQHIRGPIYSWPSARPFV